MDLARRYPEKKFQFVVQDRPEVVEKAQEEVAEDMKGLITWTTHDFMEPQPSLSADVFILRRIIMDWSDKYSITILKNIALGMKPDSRVVLVEPILPAPNSVTKTLEKFQRWVHSDAIGCGALAYCR